MYLDVEKFFMRTRGPYKPRRPLKALDTLGRRIQALRQAFGLSQAELADALHVPQQSISSWERDRSDPHRIGLAMLAAQFGVSEEILRSGVGFQIPAATPDVMVPSPGGDEGGLLVTENGHEDVLRLPEAAPGEAWRVIVGEAQAGPMTKEEALHLVAKAFDQGDVLWVLVKPKKQAFTRE